MSAVLGVFTPQTEPTPPVLSQYIYNYYTQDSVSYWTCHPSQLTHEATTMFKAIKQFFKAIASLFSIITGLIHIGGKAVADADKEYDSWSSRRQATKAQLASFYANYDTIEELTEKLQDVESADVPEAIKVTLRAELNEQLKQFITATPAQTAEEE